VRHRTSSPRKPVRGIELYFARRTKLGVLEAPVRKRVIEYFFREFYVFEAIFADLLHVTRAPPAERLRAVGAFLLAERRFGDGVELEAPAHGEVDLTHEVEAFDACEVAGVILVEKRNIEVVGIVTDQNIRALKYLP